MGSHLNQPEKPESSDSVVSLLRKILQKMDRPIEIQLPSEKPFPTPRATEEGEPPFAGHQSSPVCLVDRPNSEIRATCDPFPSSSLDDPKFQGLGLSDAEPSAFSQSESHPEAIGFPDRSCPQSSSSSSLLGSVAQPNFGGEDNTPHSYSEGSVDSFYGSCLVSDESELHESERHWKKKVSSILLSLADKLRSDAFFYSELARLIDSNTTTKPEGVDHE